MSPLSASDFRALQGTWEQTALEDSGVLNPVDAHSAPGATTTIAGDRFEVTTVSGEILLAGRFELDASTTPKSITWTDAIGEDAGKPAPTGLNAGRQADRRWLAGRYGSKLPRHRSNVGSK